MPDQKPEKKKKVSNVQIPKTASSLLESSLNPPGQREKKKKKRKDKRKMMLSVRVLLFQLYASESLKAVRPPGAREERQLTTS